MREPALDVGTGRGTGARVLHNLGLHDVCGIDSNNLDLSKAQCYGNLKAEHAILGDAQRLTELFGKDRFGTVTAFHAPIASNSDNSPWESVIPLQMAEVVQPRGIILCTIMTKWEADKVKHTLDAKVDGSYKQINLPGEAYPDAFIYVGKKR